MVKHMKVTKYEHVINSSEQLLVLFDMKQTWDKPQPQPFVKPQASSDLLLLANMNQRDRLTSGSNKSPWPVNNNGGDCDVV